MGLESLSGMNLDKLKNSAVNKIINEKSEDNETSFEQPKKVVKVKPNKKIVETKDQSELAKELEALKKENERLKSLKAGKVRFKDFKATTFRVKEEQYNLLKEFEETFPDRSTQLENLSLNSIVRGLLDHLSERSEDLDFTNATCDLDIHKELTKIFN